MEPPSPELCQRAFSPDSVCSVTAFNQLLSHLRSAYEEVCDRNLMLERKSHLERGCGEVPVECKPEVDIHGSADGLVDPWCPINFLAPADSPETNLFCRAAPQHIGQQHLQVASKQFQVAALHTTTQLKECANVQNHDELAKSIAQQVVQQLQSVDIQCSPESASTHTKLEAYIKSAQDANPCSAAENEPASPNCKVPKGSSSSTVGTRASTGTKASNKRSSNMGIMSQASYVGDDGNCLDFVDHLLHKKEFEAAIIACIAMSCIVMCIETQYQGLDVGKDLEYPGRTHPAADVWPGAKYFLDFQGLKLGVGKCKFLRGVQGWNWLDFLCVVTFCTDKVAKNSAIDPQMLRLLRLLRLWRLVRLVRFLETVDHLYVMTTAIASLGKVLAWAVLLLTTMLLLCDLLLVQILHATYFNKVVANDLTDDQLRKHQQMYAYFGTFTRGMLSMYEITMGNWPPIARLLSEEVSEWFTLLCLIHKLTIGFAVIGVITGVILQETFKVAQTDDLIMFRQKQRAGRILREKMEKLFDVLDDSGDGQLAVQEFNTIGDFPEIKTWLSSLDIETDDLVTLFNLIDVEGNGYVTLDELVARIPRIKGNARSIDVLAMRRHLM